MPAVFVFWGWSLTALSGAVVLGAWLSTPNVRRARTATGHHRRLPPSLVFSHLSAAACGLLVWSLFVFWGLRPFAWVALVLITVTATLGLTMFVRWVPTYRFRPRLRTPTYRMTPVPGSGHGELEDWRWHSMRGRHRIEPARRRRQNLPLTVVSAHGVLAVTTVTLMVVTILAMARV